MWTCSFCHCNCTKVGTNGVTMVEILMVENTIRACGLLLNEITGFKIFRGQPHCQDLIKLAGIATTNNFPAETSSVWIGEFLKKGRERVGGEIEPNHHLPSELWGCLPPLQQTKISSEELVLRILILPSQQYHVGFSWKQLNFKNEKIDKWNHFCLAHDSWSGLGQWGWYRH